MHAHARDLGDCYYFYFKLSQTQLNSAAMLARKSQKQIILSKPSFFLGGFVMESD